MWILGIFLNDWVDVHKPGFLLGTINEKLTSAPFDLCSLANVSSTCSPVVPVDEPGVRLPTHLGGSTHLGSFMAAFDVELPMGWCKGDGKRLSEFTVCTHLDTQSFCIWLIFLFGLTYTCWYRYRVRRASWQHHWIQPPLPFRGMKTPILR